VGPQAPHEAYLRLGRRERVHGKVPATPAPPPRATVPGRPTLGWGTRISILVVLGLASVAAVAVDLSSLDPFGRGLGWSPGLVLVFLIAALILILHRLDRYGVWPHPWARGLWKPEPPALPA